MSQTLIVAATTLVAFLLGRLTAWPAIRRRRAELADAAWRAGHDPLTGMLNRAGLYRAHATAAHRGPQPMLVLLIDLDEFKPVNDTHGHQAGDDLLVAIGERISQAAHLHGGSAARLSGDEFAAMLPVRGHDFGRVADLFVTMIGQPVELTIDGTPNTMLVTASIGAAIAEASDPLEHVALRRADLAMYHAKCQGGNRYAIYEPGMAMPTMAPRRGPRPRELRQPRWGLTA